MTIRRTEPTTIQATGRRLKGHLLASGALVAVCAAGVWWAATEMGDPGPWAARCLLACLAGALAATGWHVVTRFRIWWQFR